LKTLDGVLGTAAAERPNVGACRPLGKGDEGTFRSEGAITATDSLDFGTNVSASSWPGFVPAIHALKGIKKGVDARFKPGHDERGPRGRHAP
jgi:hypothetical protein